MTIFDQLEEALALEGNERTLEDVLLRVERGDAQFWHEGNGAVVTEVLDTKAGKVLHFWLAAGSLDDVLAIYRKVVEWGRANGCVRATLIGRRGWVKVLQAEGWAQEAVTMGRAL